MPDTLNLTLDSETERTLVQRIEHEIDCGRFHTSHGCSLVLDSGPDPSQGELVRSLGRYIDFEAGGLKVLDVPLRGARARFTVVPAWETSPQEIRGKSFGGPSITLRFTLTW
jgi:hypothetical protein